MSVEAEAAERVLRMEIMLTESAVKLAATGAVNLAMLLIAAVRNEVHMVEELMWQKCWSKANRSQHFLLTQTV